MPEFTGPEFSGDGRYDHAAPARIGILLTNLGTPTAPTSAALRTYLAEFLSDERVIEVPRMIWWGILHGLILRFRPGKSAAMYKKIWTENGSPLLRLSQRIAMAVKSQLHDDNMEVVLGMRYGQPSIASAMITLQQANVQKLLLLPLYPQYSATTTASTFDAVSAVLQRWRWLPELRMIRHYHTHAQYIAALVKSIRLHWAEHGQPDKLLFSFHGIPESYFLAGDPYHCECHHTARLIAEQMQLETDRWAVAFQSRFGPRKWLQPYTDKLLSQWGKSGIAHVQVICPGFAADCLETLEEINMQNRQVFLQAGGEKFSYIPALNDHPLHIKALCGLIEKHTQGWAINETDTQREERAARAARMQAAGR